MNESREPFEGPDTLDNSEAPDGSDASVLERLAAAGLPLDELGEEQREVLAALSPAEAELLLSLKSRLDAVGPEVQAHASLAGGALF